MARNLIQVAAVALAVSLGAGSTLGTHLAGARLERADPEGDIAAAMSTRVHEIEAPSWFSDRVLIELVDGADFDKLAADYRAAVVRPPIAGGYGVLMVPKVADREGFITRIRDDLRVRDVSRMPEGDALASADL